MTVDNPFVFIVQILVTFLLSPADYQVEIRDQRGFSRGSVIADAGNATWKNINHGQEAFASLDFIATLHYPPTASPTASAQGAFPRDIKGARQLDLLRGHGCFVNMTVDNPFVFIVQTGGLGRRKMVANVSTSSGNTIVEVPGMEVEPEECAGWLHVKIGKQNEVQEAKANTRAVRRTMAASTRAARMPGILPKEENKIIVRPRGGLNLAKTSAITVMTAIRTAASFTRAETMDDTQCPNVQQNIVVISTPDDLRARKYAGVKEIKIEDRTYEVSAYAAALDGAVKGVVRGIPVEDSAETITDNILNARNPKARAAQRIGSSTTIIVVFEGPKVPNYVYYGGGLLRCTLYRKHYEDCRCCGKVGHRVDVCPTPETKVCIGCGEKTDRDHQCTPKCKLCGGPHVSGDN
ncbi:hypothetical protein HPB47_019046 [Ixodes persulcatus]|uniref:Uncharacterized protein n=1 Tax=Ixodes persulcatus TaxID=34615 RepID=A0AC60QJ77_IXOPE|nr:hypothetical protein HPB47_019046 [Ixodes persulcatus]